MATYIHGRHGRASAADMLELLGFKRTANLPKEGLPAREIQGVVVFVKPSTSGGTRATRKCSHRVIAVCTCGLEVPVGRLHQHKCDSKRSKQVWNKLVGGKHTVVEVKS